jgi:hypothetical protein
MLDCSSFVVSPTPIYRWGDEYLVSRAHRRFETLGSRYVSFVDDDSE